MDNSDPLHARMQPPRKPRCLRRQPLALASATGEEGLATAYAAAAAVAAAAVADVDDTVADAADAAVDDAATVAAAATAVVDAKRKRAPKKCQQCPVCQALVPTCPSEMIRHCQRRTGHEALLADAEARVRRVKKQKGGSHTA